MVKERKDMEIVFELVNENAKKPIRANETDSGWDLFTCSDPEVEIRKIQGKDYIVNFIYDTGVRVAFPNNVCGFVYPRSSVKKYDLIMSNSVGVIDEGYRGNIMVAFRPIVPMLAFDKMESFSMYRKGDRIAQLVITRRENFVLVDGNVSTDTSRSTGGFGSSGIK